MPFVLLLLVLGGLLVVEGEHKSANPPAPSPGPLPPGPSPSPSPTPIGPSPSPSPGPGPQPQPAGLQMLPAGSTTQLQAGETYLLYLNASDYQPTQSDYDAAASMGFSDDVTGYFEGMLTSHFFPNGYTDYSNFVLSTNDPNFWIISFTSNVNGTAGGPMMSAFAMVDTGPASGGVNPNAPGGGGFGLGAPGGGAAPAASFPILSAPILVAQRPSLGLSPAFQQASGKTNGFDIVDGTDC